MVFREQRRWQEPFAKVEQDDDDELVGVFGPVGDLNRRVAHTGFRAPVQRLSASVTSTSDCCCWDMSSMTP
jgi:hypothetical protein